MAVVEHLSQLLLELDNPQLGNDRRHALELQLAQLQEQHDTGAFALQLLTTDQARLHWYAATLLEATAKHRWAQISEGDRSTLISTLAAFLEQHFEALAPFARSKLLVSFVTMGLQEQDGLMPGFITNVLQWCRSSSLLGFTCLKILTEESMAAPASYQQHYLQEVRSALYSSIRHHHHVVRF